MLVIIAYLLLMVLFAVIVYFYLVVFPRHEHENEKKTQRK